MRIRNNKLIKVKPPINLVRKDIADFQDLSYELSPLKIFNLENVLVTYEGVCLIKSGIIKESIYGYRDKISICSLTTQLSVINNKLVVLNNTNYYLLIHGPLFGFYHWMTESIPRLLLLENQIKSLILLLPEFTKNIDFIFDSLKPFPECKFHYIRDKTNIQVRHLILPQIKPYFSSYYPDTVNRIRSLYTGLIKKKSTKKKLFDKVFLINSKDNYPAISTIRELRKISNPYGIKFLSIAHYSFYEKVEFFQNARIIISVSCDDLTCIHFMNKRTSVLELMEAPIAEIGQPLSLRFLNLASALDIDYYYQFCLPMNYSNGMNRSKMIVDLNSYEKNLRLILHLE